MKVAVLMGGNSSEREVSLNTGNAVVKALISAGVEAEPCIYNDTIGEVLSTLRNSDVVFNALHGGEGENGTVQGLLQSLKIKFTGSDHKASAIAMDKHLTKLILRNSSIPTPDWMQFNLKNTSRINLKPTNFVYPFVVKPNADGSTMGVSIVKSESGLDDAVRLASEFGSEILFEEYIPGREITVSILGEKALPIIEIIPSHDYYDYACKYTEGMSRYECPANLPEDLTKDIQDTARRIVNLLACKHYCRVDFRLNPENDYYCLEINTLPGMTSTSLVPKAAKAVGISFQDLVIKIVEFAQND